MSDDGFRIPVRGQKTIECPQCNFVIETVPLKILKTKILIVEGKDDLELFEALTNKLQISDIQLIDFNGKYGWREKMSGLIQDRNFIKVISLGLIRDADVNATDTFRSVQNALKATGLPIPNRPLTAAKGMPKVNVLIVPPEKKEGTLEELCLNAVADDPALICVNQYFECLDHQKIDFPRESSKAKAKVRVFLCSRGDPTLPLGIAAQKGYWPLDSKAFATVKGFLKSL